jgi:putative SOS response-associated peptidase YedK
MCGRFNIIDDPFARLLMEITGQQFSIETRFNIAPTEQIPVLVKNESKDWALREMRWWLVPYWSKEPTTKYSMFNARSETLTKSSAFREPFRKRRCIIPASGYYEWRKVGGSKAPCYIEPDDETGFAFAGLWDRWRGDDRVIESCTIVTAAAPESMKSIHSRIPVHLSREQIDEWLDPDRSSVELMQLLAPEIRFPLSVTPVSNYVNNTRNRDERCIERLGGSTLRQPAG